MAGRKLTRRVAHRGPEIVLGLVILFAGVSLWQAWAVTDYLREEAASSSRIYGRITAALADPSPGADTETLLPLVTEIRKSGIPLVVTDRAGRPAAAANLPFSAASGDLDLDDPRVTAYAADLDRVNAPIDVPGLGTLHYGLLPAARRLNWLTWVQLGLLATTLVAGAWAYRTAVNRHRDRLWVAMARESAHQLGTPLMSAGAWVDRLADGATAPAEIARHLRADLDRLRRVAQRFERIGRPARRDQVALGALAERVAAYFTPRLPRHAHPVVLTVRAPAAGPLVAADPVLVEWALEALVRNAVDTLSGRGGRIEISITDHGDRASILVADDGPGIPLDIRATVFEPGVTTKPGGWGIGLALARRIVEDVHGGSLSIVPSSCGATFAIELPVMAEDRADRD